MITANSLFVLVTKWVTLDFVGSCLSPERSLLASTGDHWSFNSSASHYYIPHVSWALVLCCPFCAFPELPSSTKHFVLTRMHFYLRIIWGTYGKGVWERKPWLMQYPGAKNTIFSTSKFEKIKEEYLLGFGRKQLCRKSFLEVWSFARGYIQVRGNLPWRTLECRYLDFIFLCPFIEASKQENRKQGILVVCRD